MVHQTGNTANSENSYLQLFDKAQDNFALICKEYKDTPFCKRTKRRQNVNIENRLTN